MVNHASLCVALLGLSLAVAACAAPADIDPDDQLGEITSGLSVSSWSLPIDTGANADYGGQIATLNGTTYMVRSQCCPGGGGLKDLAWLKRTSTGWTSSTVIVGQQSDAKVSLAAFNGYLYMVASGGGITGSELRLSRFDPATETWSPASLLPFRSNSGPPAIAVFQNQLRFVGVLPQTQQLWTATMTAAEALSPATLIPGHAAGRRPSAAVFNSRLFVVHRAVDSSDIVYSTFNGTAWSAEQFIPGGPPGTRLRGQAPVIAAVNGFLHLINWGNTATVTWAYFDRCAWTAEISIGSLSSDDGPSLIQGGPGLVLLTTRLADIFAAEFAAPPTPIGFPPCSVINP